MSRKDARRWLVYYRDEIEAVIDLELRGIRCPATFDGGAYLRECINGHREAERRLR